MTGSTTGPTSSGGRLAAGPGAVAIVTGGGFNIGRAAAIRLARAGARVVVSSRNAERLEATVGAIQGLGGEALAVPADVTQPSDLDAVVERTLDHFGRVDVLVAAAGSGAHAPLDRVDPAEWRDVFERNVLGTFHAARSVLPAMRARDRGVLITFAGGGAFFPQLGGHITAYATAKAAVCRLTDQLQAELLDTGIRVHCVEPGMVWSEDRLREVEAEEKHSGQPHPHRDLNRSPEDAAELVLFLASEAAASLRGRLVSVADTWWKDPDQVRRVEATVHLYRLRRAEDGAI